MTYLESARGEIITKARTIKELRDHGIDFSELVSDLGEHDFYDAYKVLQWLGY